MIRNDKLRNCYEMIRDKKKINPTRLAPNASTEEVTEETARLYWLKAEVETRLV